MKIKLRSREYFLERGIEIPGYIWAEPPFSFKPQDFGVGNEYLKERIIPDEVQTKSIELFQQDPTFPGMYGVASAPSDLKAKYFAAFLVQTYLENAPANKTIRWESLTADPRGNATLVNTDPSLVVMTGLTPNSTPYKLEKARDLLEHFHTIPRIVVIAGEDPVTFFSSKLYLKPSRIFFHCSTQVKRKVETL